MAFEVACETSDSPAISHAPRDMTAATRTNVAGSIPVLLIFSSLHGLRCAAAERMGLVRTVSAHHLDCTLQGFLDLAAVHRNRGVTRSIVAAVLITRA